jgi:hypothetical protein
MGHTPAPWIYSRGSDDYRGDHIINSNGEPVITGSCYADINISDDNARLVTAAPELLELLEEFCCSDIDDKIDLLERSGKLIAKILGT